jgi:hypothetical protein
LESPSLGLFCPATPFGRPLCSPSQPENLSLQLLCPATGQLQNPLDNPLLELSCPATWFRKSSSSLESSLLESLCLATPPGRPPCSTGQLQSLLDNPLLGLWLRRSSNSLESPLLELFGRSRPFEKLLSPLCSVEEPLIVRMLRLEMLGAGSRFAEAAFSNSRALGTCASFVG